MVTSSGQTESIEDVIDVDPGSGCRFSGMEAPAEVEWSTAGKGAVARRSRLLF
ncbi:hypothetical protein LNP05_29925 [Klebsiella pneumoniae subsp. pneumoniae]|nr:hypothetical protein [Klebsiella variicola subsp. variicola]MCS5949219.1 hypothetical protein [Klebsiella pneumoniae subsp. pneumoniae]